MKKGKITLVTTSNALDLIVKSIRGGQVVSAMYKNNVETCNKKLQGGRKNPYYGRIEVVKIMTSLQVGNDYESNVSNRAGVAFEAEPLPWGTWFEYKRIIAHKGEHYVRLYETKNTKTHHLFFLDGKEVKDGDLKKSILAAFRKKGASKRQLAVGLSPEEQVKPINIRYSNLLKLKAAGRCYEVVKF